MTGAPFRVGLPLITPRAKPFVAVLTLPNLTNRDRAINRHSTLTHSRPVRSLSRWRDGLDNEPFAYSIVGVGALGDEYLVSTHELGHNLGCGHHRDDVPEKDQSLYAHAYRYCGGKVR